MGDRANVVIKDGEGEVWLYTHWRGTELPDIVRGALARNQRWDDAAYLARIVFCEMIGKDVDGETGFGISTGPCDNEHDIIVLNVPAQSVEIYAADTDTARPKGKALRLRTFAEYAAETPKQEAL